MGVELPVVDVELFISGCGIVQRWVWNCQGWVLNCSVAVVALINRSCGPCLVMHMTLQVDVDDDVGDEDVVDDDVDDVDVDDGDDDGDCA